jgi:hypothetical protein
VWAWGTFTDAANRGTSRVSLIEDYEERDGGIVTVYNIAGEITSAYEYGYAGWYAIPDDPTLELLKTAKACSFKVLGDGNSYSVMLCTSDIADAAYFRTEVFTKKDQVSTVTVRTGSLHQPEDWGGKKPFNQNNATQIQFQTTNNGKPGTFKLQVYDLRLVE